MGSSASYPRTFGGSAGRRLNPVDKDNSVNDPIFSTAELERFFAHLAGTYACGTLADRPTSSGVILRRDVDLEVNAAHRMSVLEEKHGLRASYLIMTTNHAYNPASPQNRALLRDMASRGFDIGLHFDPFVYGDVSDVKLQRHAEDEASFLSEACGAPVRSVSIHNPSFHGQYPMLNGFVNAYSPELFEPNRYWSDSLMRPRKDLWAFIAGASAQVLQVLMHPFHYSATGAGYRDLFVGNVREYAAALDSQFRPVNAHYRDAFPEPIHEIALRPTPGLAS